MSNCLRGSSRIVPLCWFSVVSAVRDVAKLENVSKVLVDKGSNIASRLLTSFETVLPAMPQLSDFVIATREMPVKAGESPKARTIFTIVSLLCISLLSFMFGSRARHLRLNMIMRMNFTRAIVITMYVLAICFVFSEAIVQHGLGLATPQSCGSAIVLCLVFYLGGKMAMYIFLVERAHALRAPYVRRVKDIAWVVGMVAVISGLGAIAIVGFLYPLSNISKIDGLCRIGVPLKVSIPIMSYDIVIQVSLTALFVYHLIPSLRFGIGEDTPFWAKCTPQFIMRRMKFEADNLELFNARHSIPDAGKLIKWLAWKSTIGCCLTLIPTVFNMGLLFHMQGNELGWLCLTLCTFDSCFGVCIIHWLTVDPMEVDGKIGAASSSREHITLSSANSANSAETREPGV